MALVGAARAVSKVPFPILVLCIALVTTAVQGAFARRALDERTTRVLRERAEEETIFVCLVGDKLSVLRSLAAEVRASAAVPGRVSVGCVVVVRDARQVARETTQSRHVDDGVLYAPTRASVSTAWLYSKRPREALHEGRREALRTLYQGEKFVLFLHGAMPTPDWDRRCAVLLTARQQQLRPPLHAAITAVPVDADSRRGSAESSSSSPSVGTVGRFPHLQTLGADGSVSVRTRAFAVAQDELVPSTVLLRAFVFATHEAVRACGDALWAGGQLEATARCHERGLRAFVCGRALARRSGKHGVDHPKPAGRGVQPDHPAFGAHPRAGLVQDEDPREAIVKFGNLDVASILLRQLGDEAPPYALRP